MPSDLNIFLSSAEKLPTSIGVYQFTGLRNIGESDIQISYSSIKEGWFTITVYGVNGEVIPDDVNDPIIREEFETCVATLFEYEKVGRYQNVELFLDEPFSFEENEEDLFQSAFFTYQRISDEGEISDKLFSILFLRSDGGYFHKIRYSVSLEDSEASFDNMGKFLSEWLGFILKVNHSMN